MSSRIVILLCFFNIIFYKLQSQSFSTKADSIEYILGLQVKDILNYEDSIFIHKKSEENCNLIDSFLKCNNYSGAFKTYLTTILVKKEVCIITVVKNINYFQMSQTAIRIPDRFNYPVSNAFNIDNTLHEILFNTNFLDDCEVLNNFSKENITTLSYLLKPFMINVDSSINYSKCKALNIKRLKKYLKKN